MNFFFIKSVHLMRNNMGNMKRTVQGILLLGLITGAPAQRQSKISAQAESAPAESVPFKLKYGPACHVWGDVHVLTFDGHRSIDYQGQCTHTLARRCCATCDSRTRTSCRLIDFHVMSRPRASGLPPSQCPWLRPTVPQDIIIDICGYTIVLSNNPYSYKVTARTIPQFLCTLNPSTCNLPCAGSTFTINYLTSGGWIYGVKFTSPQLRVTVLRAHRQPISVYVELYVGYMNKTCGVCGNFDGIPVNDLVTRGGVDVSSKPDYGCPNKVLYSWRDNEIGNSWTMYDPKIPNCRNPVIPYPAITGRKKRQAKGVFREDALAINAYADSLGLRDTQLASSLAYCEEMVELDVEAVPELRESMLCAGIMCASQAISRALEKPVESQADIITERYQIRGCINEERNEEAVKSSKVTKD